AAPPGLSVQPGVHRTGHGKRRYLRRNPVGSGEGTSLPANWLSPAGGYAGIDAPASHLRRSFLTARLLPCPLMHAMEGRRELAGEFLRIEQSAFSDSVTQ